MPIETLNERIFNPFLGFLQYPFGGYSKFADDVAKHSAKGTGYTTFGGTWYPKRGGKGTYFETTATTPPALGAPRNVSADPGGTSLRVSWSAASGSPTGYTVWWQKNGGTWNNTSVSASARSHNVTGLSRCTNYQIAVTSLRGADTTQSQNLQTRTDCATTATTPPALGAPRNVSADPGGTNLRVSWSAASGSPTGYTVWWQKNGGTWNNTSVSASARSHNVTGLSRCTNYQIAVTSLRGAVTTQSQNLQTRTDCTNRSVTLHKSDSSAQGRRGCVSANCFFSELFLAAQSVKGVTMSSAGQVSGAGHFSKELSTGRLLLGGQEVVILDTPGKKSG